MERGYVFVRCALVWVLGIAVFSGCDDSPVGPMPPPEITYVTAPDSEGYATVSGVVDTLFEEEQVLVFNDDTGDGVMERLIATGEFEVRIVADEGDVVVVQTKSGFNLSTEQMREVPAR